MINSENEYLICERKIVFILLMLSAGMMGAYTFNLRGGVFCNAQTANFVMMAIAFGHEKWWGGFYYLIPVSAYLLGTIISEILPNYVKKSGVIRWDTLLIFLELIVLFIIGFIPLSVPHQIVQVSINFICSMQYNTYRQAEGIPVATTFCTNHLRQTGVCIVKYIRKKDTTILNRGIFHTAMLASFFAGGLVLTIACKYLQEKAIWLAMLPLFINLCILLYGDLVREHDLLYKVPSGH